MKSVFLKQPKPLKVKILGVLLLLLLPFALVDNENPFLQILIMIIISSLLLGYSIIYEIRKDFVNYKCFALFGWTVWKQKLDIEYPEYISIFSASFKQDNEWGTVSALGTRIEDKSIVLRFFNDQRYFTAFKNNKYQKVLDKAKEVSELLEVEIYNAIEK